LRSFVDEMDFLLKSGEFDPLDYNELDRAFHSKIIECSRNKFLIDTYASLNVHEQVARLFQQRALPHGKTANREHRALYQAIARRDAQAAEEALKSHTDSSRARLLRLVAETNESATNQEVDVDGVPPQGRRPRAVLKNGR
jgi:DNA-binding GntR family transcriptional regulator